jgi:hypothetical protein
MPSPRAIGVSKLTGMNSDATSTKVSKDMQITAPHEVPVSSGKIASEVATDVMVVTFWFNLWGRRADTNPLRLML